MSSDNLGAKTGTLETTKAKGSVGFYITCLVNTLRPQVAWDSIALIESLGFDVDVPEQQTCCGQPGYNSGHPVTDIAEAQIALLEPYDYVVIPSGSCAGMIKNHYPQLPLNHAWKQRAQRLAERTFELSDFLLHHNWRPAQPIDMKGAAHHTSCSCRRDIKTHTATEALLRQSGITPENFEEQEVCCGFGGAFSEKFSAIGNRMAENKLANIRNSGCRKVISADLGCLLHLQRVSQAQNNSEQALEFHHVAQALTTDNPES